MPQRSAYLATGMVVLFALLGGCGDGGKSTEGLTGAASNAEWAIAVDAFEGPNHQGYADQLRMQLTSQTRMTAWWVKAEADKSLVLYGKYAGPQDRRAKADLQKLQQLAAAGRIRTRTLMLTPIESTTSGSADTGQYDLRRAASRGVYTLQMAVYDREFGKDYRQAAEKAAAVLREDGDDAYFYHGPNRSMVTVGIFGADAVGWRDTEGGRMIVYSPLVQELHKKYPYNLVNGRTMRVKQADGKFHEQPSYLVRIPGQE